MMHHAFLAVLLVFTVSLNLVALVCMWARTRQLDIPNERSSHTVPTPRGGGIAIVVATLGSGVLLWLGGHLPGPVAAAVLGGGTLVALVGHIDDRTSLAATPRLIAQLVAVLFCLACIGGVPEMRIGSFTWEPGILGFVIALVGLTWLINLTNFMDGIDGLVASYTIFVGIVGGALLWQGGVHGEAIFLWLLASAALGFLVFNWAPATIFMGDVSSGFLGLVVGIIAVATSDTVSLWVWGVLVAPFIADATVTRAVRGIRYKDWFGAHRTHLYQRLSRKWKSHATVVCGFWLLNLLVVLPAAIAAQTAPQLGWAIMGFVWLVFFTCAWGCGAGLNQEPG